MSEYKDIPYIVFEGAMSQNERHIKRLVIALLISVILIFVSNAFWLYAWCQYDYSDNATVYTQDGLGFNNINTGTQGDVTNGTDIDN